MNKIDRAIIEALERHEQQMLELASQGKPTTELVVHYNKLLRDLLKDQEQ